MKAASPMHRYWEQGIAAPGKVSPSRSSATMRALKREGQAAGAHGLAPAGARSGQQAQRRRRQQAANTEGPVVRSAAAKPSGRHISTPEAPAAGGPGRTPRCSRIGAAGGSDRFDGEQSCSGAGHPPHPSSGRCAQAPRAKRQDESVPGRNALPSLINRQRLRQFSPAVPAGRVWSAPPPARPRRVRCRRRGGRMPISRRAAPAASVR